MNPTTEKPLLESAWRLYAALDAEAVRLQNRYLRLRKAIAILSVLAVLLAILVDAYNDTLPPAAAVLLRALLILTPILISVLAAFGNKFMTGQKYIAYRAAAEAALKEIYLYRTANRSLAQRDKILGERLRDIQRDLFRGAGGELLLSEYTGPIPVGRHRKDDDGLSDLDGEQYLALRLEDQLDWHRNRSLQIQRQRQALQWGILIFSGIGAFFAAWGEDLSIWVALTAAVASALVGWEELRGLEERLTNYSQVVLELSGIRDWWLTLTAGERAQKDNIAALAHKTEQVLFDKNLEWANAMRRALASAESEEALATRKLLDQSAELSQRLPATLSTGASPTDQAAQPAEAQEETPAAPQPQTFVDEDSGDEEAPQTPGEMHESWEDAPPPQQETFVDEDFSDEEAPQTPGEMHESWEDAPPPQQETFVDEDFGDEEAPQTPGEMHETRED